MKNLFYILMLAIGSILTIPSHAQTYTGVISGPYPCGHISGVNCYGFPMAVYDGTALVTENAWINQNVAANSLVWPYADPLGLDNTVSIAKFTSPVQTLSTAPGTQRLFMTFAGTNKAGRPYTGNFNLTYTTYLAGRWGWYWVITGGTVTIQVNQSSVTPDSPVAPTPVCIQGDPNCPPHDWNQ